jgi:hypothetical protein
MFSSHLANPHAFVSRNGGHIGATSWWPIPLQETRHRICLRQDDGLRKFAGIWATWSAWYLRSEEALRLERSALFATFIALSTTNISGPVTICETWLLSRHGLSGYHQGVDQ